MKDNIKPIVIQDDYKSKPPLKREKVSETKKRNIPLEQRFDEKYFGDANSSEERIKKLQVHIADQEERIIELQNAKDRASNAFDEFLSLQGFSEMVRSTQDPAQVLNELMQLVHSFIEYDEMGLYLIGKGRNLEPLGPAPPFLYQAAQEQYNEGVIDWIISERRPVVVSWNKGEGLEENRPAKNLVLIPLIVGDKALGFAVISTTRSTDWFTSRELRMLYFAVSHAAVAIQNAQRTQEITETKDFLSNLLENAGDIILALDQTGKFTFLNPRIDELEYRKEDLLGKDFTILFTDQSVQNYIRNNLRAGGKHSFEIKIRTRKFGVQQYTVNLAGLKGEEGERIGTLGIMRNVTEINKLQTKLLESERLTAYTQTVITLNHEINNPLTTVLGNAYLMEKEAEALNNEKLTQRLKIIQENCMRIQDTIKKLEKIDELKTISYLGHTMMLDIGQSRKQN